MELLRRIISSNSFIVLILIVMEDTHGALFLILFLSQSRLNPYCNGRYSWSRPFLTRSSFTPSLNPYCNGRYSWSKTEQDIVRQLLSLNPYCNGRYSWRNKESLKHSLFEVLILIVMEDTHGVYNYEYNN